MAKRSKIKPTFGGKVMFPSEWIVAEDLAGKDVSLTISRVSMEKRPTDDGPKLMPSLFFEEMERRGGESAKKRLGLNITNARAIAKLHGPEATKWVGKRITIFGTTCEAFGETVTCVRVRPKAPPARGRSEPEPDLDGEEDAPEEPIDDEPPFGALESDRAAE